MTDRGKGFAQPRSTPNPFRQTDPMGKRNLNPWRMLGRGLILVGLGLACSEGIFPRPNAFSADSRSAPAPASLGWKCSGLCIRGVYPHLAALSTSYSEAGIGALAPWADRLWYVSYVAHIQGEGVGLYEILAGGPPKEGMALPGPTGSALVLANPAPWLSANPAEAVQPLPTQGAVSLPVPLAIRRHPASIVGTHANRMIHPETQQLLIGPYVIDAKGQVRVIQQLAHERLTGAMRHLTDPASKVYYLAMEGAFYEVDLATLQARKLFELTKELGIPARVHFKGAYTAQGRVVVANNSYFEEDQREGQGLGRLAQWDGQRWTILHRTAFCDVTTAAGIQPLPKDTSTLWANGWDRRSVLLCILHDGQWHTYRLPKGSQSYDQAWCTEWPRMRPLSPDLMLLDMHGLYYKMSPGLQPGQMGGLEPYAAHLKMTPDFCIWRDRLVLAGNENSSMNHRHRTGGQPQSNLWFGTWEQVGQWGRPSGWGGPWLDDPVSPDTPSDPFFVGGFEHRCLHLSAEPLSPEVQGSSLPSTGEAGQANAWPGEGANTTPLSAPVSKPNAGSPTFLDSSPGPTPSPPNPSDKPIQAALEIDPDGAGRWRPYLTLQVPVGGYAWHVLPRSLQAAWMRFKVDRPARMSAQFHFAPGEPKAVQPELFAQLPLAPPADTARSGLDPSKLGSTQVGPPANRPETGRTPGGRANSSAGQVKPIHAASALPTDGRSLSSAGQAESPVSRAETVQINGALLPFADRLWFCAYRDRGPGQNPEPAGLYEITESMQFIRRSESVPGVFSNRLMVGGTPGYLSIGPHLIAADGAMRTIPGLAGEHLVASIRLEEALPTGQPKAKEAAAQKKSKLGLLTAAGRLLEVDLTTLAVQASRDIPAELGVQGQSLRFRAAHTLGNTLIVAAVGQAERPGLLAEQSGGKWRIIDQAHYTEVCNLGSMSEQVVAVGWDAASTILMLRTANGWQKYRLPKAEENYPPLGADYSPRIREVVTERLLLDAGGLFYEVSGLPYAWSIRPITTHGRRIADFCSWRGLLVLAGCQAGEAAAAATSTEIASSAGPPGRMTLTVGGSSGAGGESGSVFRAADGVGLWFGTVDDLWLMGKIRGVGGPWLRTPVQPNAPSDPYLMCHFDRKRLELEHDAAEPVEFTVEVDFTVQRNRWHRFTSLRVPPGQKLVYEFPEGYSAHWVRLKADRACRAAARLIYE